MLLLDLPDVIAIIQKQGLQSFYLSLIDELEQDFKQWDSFYKTPRHATHYPQGVIEVMPCANDTHYSFKYVNGHPENTQKGKLCVAAIGLLADANSGYPLLISEMTLLTAIRTAAVAALGAKYLARPDSQSLTIIGCGAQSEFQALAIMAIFDIKQLKVFDIDNAAMQKFNDNLVNEFDDIICCESVTQAVKDSDIIITATAAKKRVELFDFSILKPGAHIHAMGGDSPGKTELGKSLLSQSKLVVEFKAQSLVEGEIQQLDEQAIYAELWEIISQKKAARENNEEITLFDSVGFALEDFSTLRLLYKLADKLKIGADVDLVPDLKDPKNLYSLLNNG